MVERMAIKLQDQVSKRFEALRTILQAAGLDGFIVPRSDAFMGEYVAPCDDRLRWLFNFSGSAGLGALTLDRAALFVDGRYRIQAKQELEGLIYQNKPIECYQIPENRLEKWLPQSLKADQKQSSELPKSDFPKSDFVIGFDPWLMRAGEVLQLKSALAKHGIRLKAHLPNLIDQIWHDQPPPPKGQVKVHPVKYAGLAHDDKRKAMAQKLDRKDVDLAVLVMCDSIAWLLNIRGGDVPYNPLLHARALLHRDGLCELFCDLDKISKEVKAHLGNHVKISPLDQFESVLKHYLEAPKGHDKALESALKIQVARGSCPYFIVDLIEQSNAVIVDAPDPCQLAKACKNKIEFDHIRHCHVNDGVALTRFLYWLDQHGATGSISEMDCVLKLDDYRKIIATYQGPSFETISAFGPNGAICHYRVSEAGNLTLKPGGLYLVDSGGQYLDGTTDVTRTIAIGATATDAMREDFTLVLKGHIRLAMARFPKGVCGGDLDALARASLWNKGKDYDHGTGHGVGAFLNVHEGPQSLSRVRTNTPTPLCEGMVLSNEPGFYLEDQYGIRIENLVGVKEAPQGFDGRPMLEFESFTMAPFDRSLIKVSMLDEAEICWLNRYYSDVVRNLSPLLELEVQNWLAKQCQAFDR
ncbi:MAG: aminopeptidase P family protein [Pseudomonadota bacterium]